MQSTGTALHRHGAAPSEPAIRCQEGEDGAQSQVPTGRGGEETQKQEQAKTEIPASVQARGKGVSTVVCSAALWPRQPAGKAVWFPLP